MSKVDNERVGDSMRGDGITLGLDWGGTTTSAVAMDRNDGTMKFLEGVTIPSTGDSVSEATQKILDSLTSPAHVVGLTGIGATSMPKSGYLLSIPYRKVDEATATGLGGCLLAGVGEALVVSIGTGTSFVSVRKKHIERFGGTGVGGGCLLGLAKRLLDVDNVSDIDLLAARGDLHQVDLSVGDLAGDSYGGLMGDLTAANLAKQGAKKEDIALGLMNLVAETIVVMSVFASRACGLERVLLTGNVTLIKKLVGLMMERSTLFGPTFLVPPHAEYATAIGAAIGVS